jgi:inner membrane protein
MRLPLKLLLVLGMTLAIVVPLQLIRGTINERQRYRAQAVDNRRAQLRGAAGALGSCARRAVRRDRRVEEKNDKGEVVRTVKRDGASGAWTYFPNRLEVRGRVLPSTRRLGLHEVRVYELQATAEASFSAEIPADEKPELPRRIGQPG